MSRRSARRILLGVESLEARCLLSAGYLDPTFAGDGMVATNVGLTNALERAWDVAVFPSSSPGADGKIVTVGNTVARSGTWDYDFALARYNPDGTLDSSFGQGGRVTTAMGRPGTYQFDVAFSVQLVGNKTLAGGCAEGAGFALARYNDNGSLDTNFGSQGKVLTKVNAGGMGQAMTVDPSGRIVMAGIDPVGALTVVRYTAAGTLDKSFGKGGIVTTAMAEPLDNSYRPMGLAITPASAGAADAGKIVVVGTLGSTRSLVVARYTTAGLLDASFDGDGVAVITPGGDVPSVAIQADGRMVISYNNSADLQLLRLNSDGNFDTSFDGDGKVTTSRAGFLEYTSSVAVQPDGKILVAATERIPGNSTSANFLVARYTTTGALDSTFGNGGIGISTDGSAQPINGYVALGLQENGKIVAAGQSIAYDPNGVKTYDFGVARFEGDAALHAARAARQPTADTLTQANAQPLLNEALRRWQSAGADTSTLRGIDIRIADLGGTTLGLASGHTIWLDDNAAGWGWFVDQTPWEDSEFTLPGNQGEKNRMDLLTVLAHEVGHLLGYDHGPEGVMQETLSAGERLTLPGAAVNESWWLAGLAELTKKRDPLAWWL